MTDQVCMRAVTYDVAGTDGTPGVDLVAWNPDTGKETWSWHPARNPRSGQWDMIAAGEHLRDLGWERKLPWVQTRPGVWECAVRERGETT